MILNYLLLLFVMLKMLNHAYHHLLMSSNVLFLSPLQNPTIPTLYNDTKQIKTKENKLKLGDVLHFLLEKDYIRL